MRDRRNSSDSSSRASSYLFRSSESTSGTSRQQYIPWVVAPDANCERSCAGLFSCGPYDVPNVHVTLRTAVRVSSWQIPQFFSWPQLFAPFHVLVCGHPVTFALPLSLETWSSMIACPSWSSIASESVSQSGVQSAIHDTDMDNNKYAHCGWFALLWSSISMFYVLRGYRSGPLHLIHVPMSSNRTLRLRILCISVGFIHCTLAFRRILSARFWMLNAVANDLHPHQKLSKHP